MWSHFEKHQAIPSNLQTPLPPLLLISHLCSLLYTILLALQVTIMKRISIVQLHVVLSVVWLIRGVFARKKPLGLRGEHAGNEDSSWLRKPAHLSHNDLKLTEGETGEQGNEQRNLNVFRRYYYSVSVGTQNRVDTSGANNDFESWTDPPNVIKRFFPTSPSVTPSPSDDRNPSGPPPPAPNSTPQPTTRYVLITTVRERKRELLIYQTLSCSVFIPHPRISVEL